MGNIFELPFDQYQRYKIVQDTVNILRDVDKLKVLDVGGYPGPILDFLPNDDVLVVDQIDDTKEHYQKADALALPFLDKAFDFVVSVDVYEHIEQVHHQTFLSELVRVADRAVLITAPFDHPDVLSAERALDRHHNEFLKVGNQALSEHLKNGLPNLESTINALKAMGLAVTCFPNGYLERWLPMMMLQGALISSVRNRAFLEQINAFYNKYLYKYDNCEPCYRYLIVAVKDASLTERFSLLDEKLITKRNQVEELNLSVQLYNLQLLALTSALGAVNQQQAQQLLGKQQHIGELEVHISRIQNSITYKAYKFLKKHLARK